MKRSFRGNFSMDLLNEKALRILSGLRYRERNRKQCKTNDTKIKTAL